MFQWIYNPNRKRKHFIDENVKKDENADDRDYRVKQIYKIASDNGMKQSEINSLMREIDHEKLRQPQNNNEKVDLLIYIMNLLLDDLNFDATEQDFIREYAVSILEIPVKIAPFVIREIYFSLRNEISDEEIIQKSVEILDNNP